MIERIIQDIRRITPEVACKLSQDGPWIWHAPDRFTHVFVAEYLRDSLRMIGNYHHEDGEVYIVVYISKGKVKYHIYDIKDDELIMVK